MSYAAAYCLYNYRFDNPSIGTSQYSNLRLICAFEKGLDPASSEAGFVLTHVDMVKHSAGLINGTVSIMDGIADRNGREDVIKGFEDMLETMRLIEDSMETMWGNSKPAHYNTFRAFIFVSQNDYCCKLSILTRSRASRTSPCFQTASYMKARTTTSHSTSVVNPEPTTQ